METYLIILIVVALFTGAIDTIGFAIQNHQDVLEGTMQKKFFHPFMQVAMRYASNFLILIVYGIHLYIKGELFSKENADAVEDDKKGFKRNKWDYLRILIPTCLDIIANFGYFTALNFLSGSVYQMLRGGILITTYLCSYFFLNAKFKRIKTVGCIVIMTGLVLVGVINLLYSTESASQQQYTLIGYGLIFVSIFVNAFHYIYEEHLVNHYKMEPLLIVGIQGIFGILLAFIYIPVFSLIPCFFQLEHCVITDSGTAVMENFYVWARQVHDNPVLLLGVIAVFLSMATYNAAGITITKQLRSLTRSIIDVSRTVLVWIAGIIITCTLGASNDNYKFESLAGMQIGGEILGFIILLFGNMIYYEVEIVKFKCLQEPELVQPLLKEQK